MCHGLKLFFYLEVKEIEMPQIVMQSKDLILIHKNNSSL